MKRAGQLIVLLVLFCSVLALQMGAAVSNRWQSANRLTYLEQHDPFYPDASCPKLITPQWVGDPGVDAVVILSIDDLRESPRYETFLRPILERLKAIDGRAPVSVLTCNYRSNDLPQFQSWLAEGLSIDVHTLLHPCPLLQNGNFAAAKSTVLDCLDLMTKIPGNRPVAFRMPCCDSMNSPSPRFYSEIFTAPSTAGNYLQIDSSVMNITTANDLTLPKKILVDEQGRERFRKYLPVETNATTRVSMKSFVTTITDYPYPYIIGNSCWEFPCAIPSDWEAFNLHGSTNPATLVDWKAGLDATVLKKGVFTLVFHPHGWSSPTQLVEFIDYAQQKYGKRVKFLNFNEALERLTKNLLNGKPLRDRDGRINAARLLDLNKDGFMDVISAATAGPATQVWNPGGHNFLTARSTALGTNSSQIQFGILRKESTGDVPLALSVNDSGLLEAAEFSAGNWVQNTNLLRGLEWTAIAGKIMNDPGIRFRDVDHTGGSELIISNPKQNSIYKWNEDEKTWKKNSFALPPGISLVDSEGRDNGVRFVDVNQDGFDDVLFSNEKGYALWLFINTPKEHLGWEQGWTFRARSGPRGAPNEIPMIVRAGEQRNNGVWFKNEFMWVQNENTAHLPDKVDRRSFQELLMGDEAPPKTVEEALRTFQLAHGFKIECVASEPLITDPVAFDWSPDGRMWVVEMKDYPLGNMEKGGSIKVLEDLDGDGDYDQAKTFLDRLNYPSGIVCWKKGVLISAAPDIIYAEDSNGDGIADVKKILFSGFREGNQQHRVNGFEYGLDGWIYCANGDSGGRIRSVATGKTIDIEGHDFRFLPETGEIETVEGQTQFGRRRDDWGNWYGNNNPNWLWHYFWPERYLKRNPYLAVKTSRKFLANYPEPNRVFSISNPQQRFNWPDAIRQVTAANSATPYRDSLFGPAFQTSIFISEPANNVIHREVVERDGFTLTSRRSNDESDREFLASSDTWFRPTMLKTGPDGALYVADMYRLVLEHPEYFPDELKNRTDLRAGEDRGRIYRIFPDKGPRKFPRMDKLDTAGLAQALDSPNGWQRDTAQRLLIERRDPASMPRVTILVGKAQEPKTQVQAIWTLLGLNLFGVKIWSYTLDSPDERTRIQALVAGEAIMDKSLREIGPVNDTIRRALTRSAGDSSAAVRFQTALSLGESGHPFAGELLMKILQQDFNNATMRTAILSSALPHAAFLLGQLKKLSWDKKSELSEFVGNLEKLISAPISSTNAFQTIYQTNSLSKDERLLRQRVVQRYLGGATAAGNSMRGFELFKQHCSTCHRFKNEGIQVGPDLGSIADKPIAELVTSILDPSAAVDPVYANSIIRLKDGQELNGVIVAQTANSIHLKNAGGLDAVLLHVNIKEIVRTDRSLMPDGLEEAVTPEDLADLMAFLNGK